MWGVGEKSPMYLKKSSCNCLYFIGKLLLWGERWSNSMLRLTLNQLNYQVALADTVHTSFKTV